MIQYYTGQSKIIYDIYCNAINKTALGLYTKEQTLAWASMNMDYSNWKWRCELKRPFLYVENNIIVGFIEFDADGHIDCLYTHPEYNRKGIGSKLLTHVLEIAVNRKVKRVYTEASHLAKGLFLKFGFTVVKENQVNCLGVPMTNWIMEKTFV